MIKIGLQLQTLIALVWIGAVMVIATPAQAPVIPPERQEVVVFLAGRVPTRGEIVRHSSGLQIEVVDGDPRRVKRLRLRNLPRAGDKPDAEPSRANGGR